MRTRIVAALAALLSAGLVGGAAHAAPGTNAEQAASRMASSAAESYSWRNVEIIGGGFVTGIEFSASEPGLAYARTDIGGAYRWDDAAGRWIPLTDWAGWDNYHLLGIESIATDPVDPDRVYLAAGTYTASWARNGAILRSTDRGRTWKITQMPFQMGGNEPGRSIGERLAIDPNKHNVLYFGSRDNGLWKSTDFGKSWHRVQSFPVEGMSGIGIGFVLFDKNSGSSGSPTPTIYVGVASKDNHLYRSTDGGETWEAVPGQPTGFIPHHGVLTPAGKLYLTYGDRTGPYTMTDGAVRVYDTDTGQWTDITPVEDPYFGFAGLAVDPQHPDTVMVTTMGRWWPDGNIYRSTDSGQTWTALGSKQALDVSASPYLKWGGEPKLGWMIGDIAIDPFNSDHVMYVTGATIYGTQDVTNADAGKPTHWSVAAQGIEETSVQDLISTPSGAHLISALGDIGGFRHNDLDVSPRAGMSSNPIFSTTTSLDYAGQAPSVVVRAGEGDDIMHAAYSTDGGTTWSPVASEPSSSAGGGHITVSADGSTIVWTPQDGNAHYSRDLGASWTQSSGLPAGVNVVADRVNPSRFYAFDPATGTFYVSTDGGASFTATVSDLPATGNGSWKSVLDREGHVWLATGTGGLWRSTDGGQNFTKIDGVSEAHTVGFGKHAPGHSYPALYMAGLVDGVRGVFRSVDAGQSWVRINDDQHQYGWIGQTITGDPRVFGRVYLGTNGRGIIYGDTSTQPEPDPEPEPEPSGRCAVDYHVQNDWGSGFTGTITITNTGEQATQSWTLEFGFAAGQQITHGWSGNWSQDGAHVTVTSKSWNAELDPGESTTIGFNGTYSGSNPEPEAFALNGKDCAVT